MEKYVNKYIQNKNQRVDALSMTDGWTVLARDIKIDILTDALIEEGSKANAKRDYIRGTLMIAEYIDNIAIAKPINEIIELCNEAYARACSVFSNLSGLNTVFQMAVKQVFPDLDFQKSKRWRE